MINSDEKRALDIIIHSIISCAKPISTEHRDYVVQDAQIVKNMSKAYLNLIKAGNERGV